MNSELSHLNSTHVRVESSGLHMWLSQVDNLNSEQAPTRDNRRLVNLTQTSGNHFSRGQSISTVNNPSRV